MPVKRIREFLPNYLKVFNIGINVHNDENFKQIIILPLRLFSTIFI